jgi:acetylornithine deacetylase/succinyl-diaminopimelate desuccinylase-like protein
VARLAGEHERPGRLSDAAGAYGLALAEARGGLPGALARVAGFSESVARRALADSPLEGTLLAHRCAILRLQAATPVEAEPTAAEALLDCHLLPGTSPRSFRDRLLLRVDDPRVQLDVVLAAPPSSTAVGGAGAAALLAALREEQPAAPALPVVLSGPTPLGVLRGLGIPAYGFTGIRVDKAELESVRGADERVRTRELQAALPRLVQAVARLRALPEASIQEREAAR